MPPVCPGAFADASTDCISQGYGQGRGGRRHNLYAFTEQGVAMLSSVLRSERAV